MDDRELTIWLARNVLGIKAEYDEELGDVFRPLESLDDARLLEDRLRELGLDRQYARELFDALLESKQYSVGAADYIYATARQRCEAVKRTWERNRVHSFDALLNRQNSSRGCTATNENSLRSEAMPGKTRRKRLLLWKDHPYCHWCKRPLRFASATIEHLTPRSKGGSYELDNLTIACYACNNRRGNNEDWQADDRHRVGYTCKMCDRTEFFTGQSLRKLRQKLRHAGWCQFFRGLVCPECALKHKVREFRPAGTE